MLVASVVGRPIFVSEKSSYTPVKAIRIMALMKMILMVLRFFVCAVNGVFAAAGRGWTRFGCSFGCSVFVSVLLLYL